MPRPPAGARRCAPSWHGAGPDVGIGRIGRTGCRDTPDTMTPPPGDGKTVGRLRPFVQQAARYAFLPASAAAASSSATPAIAAST